MDRAKDKEFHVIIGNRLKNIRTCRGESAAHIAKLIGMSHQQWQKNEKGINRVSALNLFRFSQETNIPVEAFNPFTEELELEFNVKHPRLLLEITKILSNKTMSELHAYKRILELMKC